MKKNEMFGWIAYAAMLALVLGIGFGVIQPMIQGANDADQIMNPILLLVLAVIASLILNAFLIEAGHLLGAAIGKYGVHSVNVLFFNFQKKKYVGHYGRNSGYDYSGLYDDFRAGDSVFVKKFGAKGYNEPRCSGGNAVDVPAYTELRIVEVRNSYAKVRYANKDVWVSTYNLLLDYSA